MLKTKKMEFSLFNKHILSIILITPRFSIFCSQENFENLNEMKNNVN